MTGTRRAGSRPRAKRRARRLASHRIVVPASGWCRGSNGPRSRPPARAAGHESPGWAAREPRTSNRTLPGRAEGQRARHAGTSDGIGDKAFRNAAPWCARALFTDDRPPVSNSVPTPVPRSLRLCYLHRRRKPIRGEGAGEVGVPPGVTWVQTKGGRTAIWRLTGRPLWAIAFEPYGCGGMPG